MLGRLDRDELELASGHIVAPGCYVTAISADGSRTRLYELVRVTDKYVYVADALHGRQRCLTRGWVRHNARFVEAPEVPSAPPVWLAHL